ncbi:hypothetical protein LTS72_17440 [Mycobacterium ostraviense]|uniref:hypothetical protein n=1 Tax=Mycobacterium ostraviense TaxID=2738409 RepID=UPI0015D4A406|nr:hypothetical protein [Mycobacterium ostraviense]UGT90153.1 hypothetical protein LTS72_17440 [Mycobacterium ostraviense]
MRIEQVDAVEMQPGEIATVDMRSSVTIRQGHDEVGATRTDLPDAARHAALDKPPSPDPTTMTS